MDKVIRNVWKREGTGAHERASILRHDVHPEGLDIDRVRFSGEGDLALKPTVAHVISVHAGEAKLDLGGGDPQLVLRPGVHAYLPPDTNARLVGGPGTGMVLVSAGSPAGSRGKDLLVRDETFLAACAVPGHALRWILTPQYLSRRIFLHHDQALVGRLGDPVSWFHTTMFDVAGLPKNADGESVFKMAYNSKTEINVCFDVKGDARVRMALHPYAGEEQRWGDWQALDGESSYHLNEASDGADVEWVESNGARRSLRNKHEVWSSGHVTLFCVFDPAPTGVERHKPGEYSDYEPLADVVGRPEYAAHIAAITSLDEMVDRLSLARARGTLDAAENADLRARFEDGRRAQLAIEAELDATLRAQGEGRESVIAPWRCRPPSPGSSG
jgi:hypothetical protein